MIAVLDDPHRAVPRIIDVKADGSKGIHQAGVAELAASIRSVSCYLDFC